MSLLGTIFSLGKAVFNLAGWAIVPGIILRVILSFVHRKNKPTPQKLQKSKKDIVMILAVLFFGWKMTSIVLNRDTNYYEVLGLTFPSKTSKIRKSFRKLSLEFHPDKGGTEEHFNLIREAYEILNDVNLRRVYNRLGKSVFTCKTCVSFVDYWSSMRMIDTVFNYFFAVIFLMWSTWSHSRAWMRPWLWLTLFFCFCIELVYIFSDEAPLILSQPHFQVVELLRQSYYVILSAACLVSNYWPGDHRSDREILHSIEIQCGRHAALLNQLTIMNQVILEDAELRTKLNEGYEKRARSMGILLSNPTVALQFAQESLKACGLQPLQLIGPDGQPIDQSTLMQDTKSSEAKKDK
jgi:hypothetical protein